MIPCWSSLVKQSCSPRQRGALSPGTSVVPGSSSPGQGGDCRDRAESSRSWHREAARGQSLQQDAGVPTCPTGDGDAEQAAPCFTVTCLARVWPFTAQSRCGVAPPCRETPGDKQEGYALKIPYTPSPGGKQSPTITPQTLHPLPALQHPSSAHPRDGCRWVPPSFSVGADENNTLNERRSPSPIPITRLPTSLAQEGCT